jgi:hypothetical protein
MNGTLGRKACLLAIAASVALVVSSPAFAAATIVILNNEQHHDYDQSAMDRAELHQHYSHTRLGRLGRNFP